VSSSCRAAVREDRLAETEARDGQHQQAALGTVKDAARLVPGKQGTQTTPSGGHRCQIMASRNLIQPVHVHRPNSKRATEGKEFADPIVCFEAGIMVSASTGLMNKTLAALDLTFKKSPCTPPINRVRMLPRRASNSASSSRS
jgi:hypothetical protein